MVGKLLRLFLMFLVVVVVVSACTGGSVEGEEPGVVPEVSSSTTTEAGVTGTEVASVADAPDTNDLVVLWGELWAATGLEAEDREVAVVALGDAIDPGVVSSVVGTVVVPGEHEVLTDPAVVENADGSVDIRDCVLFTPPIEGFTAPHVVEGHAVPDGSDGWIIDRAERVGRGCVPAAMADEVLDDYAAYIQALRDSGDPPDPDHPGLSETMTGEYREQIAIGNQDLLDEGLVYRDLDINNPEITDVPGSESIVILDCVEVDPDSGFYEESGERWEESILTEPGERILFEIRMRREGGKWKTESYTQVDSECDVAPTPAGLPRI